MRNRVILSLTGIDDIEMAKVVAEGLAPLVGGVLIPTWRIYLNLLRIVQKSQATIWLNVGAGMPSQLRSEIQSSMHYFFPDQLGEKPIPIEGVITLCYPHLIEQAVRAFQDGLAQFRQRRIRSSIPQDWRPQFFSTAALTTEEKDDRILNRARVAKEHGLAGVIVPCEFVAQVKAMGLKTIVTAIRDPNYPVVDDDQVITCTPCQAREADPDYIIVGRPITQRYILEQAIEATEYFLRELGVS